MYSVLYSNIVWEEAAAAASRVGLKAVEQVQKQTRGTYCPEWL